MYAETMSSKGAAVALACIIAAGALAPFAAMSFQAEQVPTMPGMIPTTIYGHVYLDDEAVAAGPHLLAWIDGTSNYTHLEWVDGCFLLEVAINGYPMLDGVKNGGVSGDVIRISMESSGTTCWAEETFLWSLGAIYSSDLQFHSAGNPAPVKINEICADNGAGGHYVVLYNPSDAPACLDGWYLEKDVDTTNPYSQAYNGAGVQLRGYIGAQSMRTVYLGDGGFLGDSADELKLVGVGGVVPTSGGGAGRASAAGGMPIVMDRVEYGNQSAIPGNTTLLDAASPPPGWAIRRISPGRDTEDCSRDFTLAELTDAEKSIRCARIPVQEGWNLVSAPLVPCDASFPTALEDGDGDTAWDRAMWYDPTDCCDPWKQCAKFWLSALNDLPDLEPGMGLWLNVTDAGDGFINITGAKQASTSVMIHPGMNMVGYPSLSGCAYTVGEFKVQTGATCVVGFDPDDDYHERVLQDSEAFAAGAGYIVYTSTDATWVVDW